MLRFVVALVVIPGLATLDPITILYLILLLPLAGLALGLFVVLFEGTVVIGRVLIAELYRRITRADSSALRGHEARKIA